MSQSKDMQEVLTAIYDFATVVEKRFSAIDQRFMSLEAKMDQRFATMQAQIDKRFDEVDRRFALVDQRFDDVYTILDRLDTRTRRMEEDQVGVIEWLKRHDRQLDRHELAITHLQNRLQS